MSENPGFRESEIPQIKIGGLGVRTSVLYNTEYLTRDETLFMELVKAGDILNLRSLLKERKVDVNVTDLRGRHALEIAIRNNDTDMVRELSSRADITIDHAYKAIFVSIDANRSDDLFLVLDGIRETAKAERKDEYPNIIINNMTPIIQAAILNRVDIAKRLLFEGHYIKQPEPSHRDASFHEELSQRQYEINSLRGLASPTYIILTSDDPILTAFHMSQNLKEHADAAPEFRDELLELSRDASEFAAKLLDQCQSSQEVETVLSQTGGFPQSRPFRFPRLYLAILLNQKEFVSRPNCQLVLTQLWLSGLPKWNRWSLSHRCLHVLTQCIFTPLLCLTFLVFPKTPLSNVFKVPLNKFIYSVTLYLIFLSLILITLFYGRRDELRMRALWSEVLVGVFIVGYVWELLLSMYTLGWRIFMRSMWSVYQLIMFSLFMISEILYLIVFATSRTVRENINRDHWQWYHPYLLGEAIYAIAAVMAFCRLLQWCQMSKSVGPLSISLNRMTGDIFRFMLILFIIFVGFCAGLTSIYKNYNGNVIRFWNGRNLTQMNAFVSVGHTLKSLFWGIYAMGSPEYADLIVAQHVRPDQKVLKHYFSEMVGYGLWALFHILTVIVLLNMLIAMMSNSFQRIQDHAYKEWMFARSSQWIQYFDNNTAIPAPFNLLPSVYCLRYSFRIFRAVWNKDWQRARESCSPERSCFPDFEEAQARQKRFVETYQNLIGVLVRRYLQAQELIERESLISSVLSRVLSSYQEVKPRVSKYDSGTVEVPDTQVILRHPQTSSLSRR